MKSDLTPLATALSEADKTGGELVTHRLSPEDFLPIAKKLCINQAMIAQNEDSSVHRYPGRIAIDNGGLKYWYGVSIFWNKTEESRFKSIDENFDGMMPNHDMMKVHVSQ